MAENQAHNVLGAEDLIGYLLKEPKIRQKVCLGLTAQAREYTQYKIDGKEERIYFAKYAWGGFSGFWNKLIGCYDHITFDDFYLKVWDALLEMTTNPIAHEAIAEGLSREVLLQGIHSKDQNILHRFFDVCRHIVDDGYWRDKGLKKDNPPHHHSNSCPFAGGIEVEVEPRHVHPNGILTVRDAVGDVFEVLNVHWKGGRL